VPVLVLIEDDPAIRVALERALSRRGHAVHAAATALSGLELVVEQVAWVDGTGYPTNPTVDPLLDVSSGTLAALRGEAANAEGLLEPGAYPLLTALVDPATIAANEPAAASAAARLSEPVWLLRALHATGDPSRIDWLIVARDGNVVLDAGSIVTSPFPGIADGDDDARG